MKNAFKVIFIMATWFYSIVSCNLFTSPEIPKAHVESMMFSSNSLSMGVGGIEYLRLSISPANAKESVKLSYSFDSHYVQVDGDKNGASISALRSGNTIVKVVDTNSGASANCVVSITGTDPTIENTPVITCTMPVIEVEAGVSKKVVVSLTGGSPADMALFSWSIDKSSIAKVEASGQNGMVQGVANGVARITVSHPSAVYPLELLVFVKPDNEKPTYITTSQNIITMARDGSEKNISVNLVNGDTSDNPFFSWEVLTSQDSNPSCLTLSANGSNGVITPRSEGNATIRITHPKALYPFDIKVRVITVVENVYIEPSETKATVSGSEAKTISAKLTGKIGYVDPSEFCWEIDTIEYCDMTVYQDSIVLVGKKNGTAKISISHPAALYSREILVFVENQTTDAINASSYITTSQNYIRTKEGVSDIELTIELVGGIAGDEKNFTWTIDDPSIISMRTVDGQIREGRSVGFQRASGKAYITAQKEGTAVITLSHPKTIITTEVLVKVLPKTAVLEAPLYITGTSLIGILKGATETLTMNLSGNVKPDDDSKITWTTENSAIVTVIGNGKDATVTAKNNGQTYVTVTHPNAENPKRVLCYVAETEEELFNYKLIYTEKSFYNIVAGSSETIYLSSINIEETEFSKVRWASSNTNVVTVAVGANNMEGIITGVSAGKTIVSASLAGVSDPVEFEITVYPEGTDLSVLPSPIYFTTSQNLLQFSVLNVNKTATVTPVQMPVSSYPGIKWEIENPSIADVIPNGRTATITSRSEGITRIHVSHLDAENTIPITVRVGEDYIISNPNTPFITASQDVVSLLSGASGVQITASLQNAPASDSFEWQIDDFTVATISSVGNKCFIVPKSVGQARITISHPDSVYDKQVLVLVQNTLEDLSAIPYLTTAQNVVQIATGTQQTITVRLKNNENLTTGFDWKSDNPHSLQIIASGQTAVFKGIQPGVARVTVSHSSCSFPLEIIATIADNSSDASLNPYITTPQNIVTVTKGSTSKSVNMTLVGGKESDNQHFLWTVDRSGIINLTSNGNNAVIKGTATGECRIIVSHPKATYSFPIVVVVEEPAPTSNLYINPSQPILTLKPADKEQTVTATLVGGTAEDKYGFTWYADNYNVIDLTYSANTAIIIPKQEGIAKITITHPKAAYDGQITVRITEYSTFAFAQPSMTITEGTTQFVSMQVPAMENDYGGRVVYSTNNEKIVTITGTNKVAQLTGVGAGTAIVAATSPSGAKSELMVYVKQAPAATQPHITCSINVISMKVTDNQRSLTATLVGTDVVATDQYNLSWEVENPSVAALVGSTGSTVLIKPIAAGETTVNISHPKTDTMFTIHVEVTSVNNGISLNKNYVALETGKTIEISATIDNGTVDDYKKITWSADKVNNEDLVSILGSGKTVAVYGIKSGQTQLTAEFNGQKVKCDMIIEASRQFNFEIQTMRIQPGQTKSFKYNLVPDDTPINWMASTNDYVTYAVDTVSKTVTVTGISEGTGSAGTVTKLTGIANSMTASVSITCAWDYKLTLGKSMIKGEPRQDPAVPDKFIIPYEVNPADAKVEVQVTKDIVTYVVDTAKKQIILTPVGEGDATLMVSAINTYNGTRFATQNCSINLLYNNLTVIPTVISKNGNFSKYYSEGGMLILGDGENMTLRFSIAEGNVNYSIDNLKFTKASSSSPDLSLTKPSADVWNIAHPTDYLEYEYLITQDSWLEYEGKRIGINWKRYKDGRDYYWYVDLGFNNSIFGKVALIHFGGDDDGGHGSNAPFVTAGMGTESCGVTIGWPSRILKDITPRRVSEAEFRRNPDWFIPSHDWGYVKKKKNIFGIVTSEKVRSGVTSEYFINPASRVPVIDTRIISSPVVGYISGTVIRDKGNQTFQIPVIVETRPCSKNN